MIKICPICGKRSKIICHSHRALRYSVYKRITEYTCSECKGHLQRVKDEPNVIEHIAICLVTIIFAISIFKIAYLDIITNIMIVCMFVLHEYYILGIKDAYYASKIVPVDDNNNLLVLKPNIYLFFKNYCTIEKYDVIVCKEEEVTMFCVHYYYEKKVATCYCLSGEISKMFNKKNSLYVNKRKVSDNAEVKLIE